MKSDFDFENLVSQNLSMVYSYTRHLVGDSNLAEDIVQETFVKVWKNLKKYNKEKSFKSWVLAIAHNTAIDWLRKKKNVVFSDFENNDGENLFENNLLDPKPLADEIFSKTENIEEIKKQVEKLNSIYRQVLFLHYDQDMTFEEISEVLNKSVNTVKSQHRRAISELRGYLHLK